MRTYKQLNSEIDNRDRTIFTRVPGNSPATLAWVRTEPGSRMWPGCRRVTVTNASAKILVPVASVLGMLMVSLRAIPQTAAQWNDCRACHKGNSKGTSSFTHPADVECMACHVPHLSNNGREKLLRAKVRVLCESPCHINMGRSHTIGQELMNPTTRQRQNLTCTSHCHDPHGSEFRGFLRMDPDDLCFSCHDM